MSNQNEQDCGTLEEIGQRDHSITSEYRIFGPPGTGKTTNLTRQIRRAVDRFGPDAVLITSFSRAAAAELAGRELPVEPDRIGTLHSHCYHALGGPQIAECNVDEWNKDNPHLQITSKKKQGVLDGEDSTEDDGEGKKEGDQWLEDLSRYRGQMLPPGAWPPALRQFAVRWQAYKDANGLLDFCDTIERCLLDVRIAPKRPSVIFADEAQDLNRMQLSLIRQWGRYTDYFIVAGDDDQTIYSFTGASPEAILNPAIPEDHKIILKQSYRVPRAVHGVANALIHQVSKRQEKKYLPRAAAGLCSTVSGNWETPDYGVLRTAMEQLERRRSVMFLATCSYMLRPIIQVLRKNAIPFHNPYRRNNGFWNPLRIGRRGSTVNRVLALLVAHPDFGEGHREWTAGDFVQWTEWLTAKGVLKHSAKSELRGKDAAKRLTIADLDAIFEAAALQSLLACFEGDHRALLRWWRIRVNGAMQNRIQFPADIADVRGPQALMESPQVIVGTIHSVKGGEADVVVLFPDLSQAGDASYQRYGPPRDGVIRQFYVGMTRARDALYIADRASTTAAHLSA
jgi:superfamily I DNA/RNA helicase